MKKFKLSEDQMSMAFRLNRRPGALGRSPRAPDPGRNCPPTAHKSTALGPTALSKDSPYLITNEILECFFGFNIIHTSPGS